jgi:hypothetical protein
MVQRREEPIAGVLEPDGPPGVNTSIYFRDDRFTRPTLLTNQDDKGRYMSPWARQLLNCPQNELLALARFDRPDNEDQWSFAQYERNSIRVEFVFHSTSDFVVADRHGARVDPIGNRHDLVWIDLREIAELSRGVVGDGDYPIRDGH